MKLIGLMGKARSGKDTAASYLYDAHNFKCVSFADPLKGMLEAAFPTINFRSGDREAHIPWLGKSPRQLMQTLGTEWGRECVHPDLWLLLAERRLSEIASAGWPGAVITDVRFDNEAQWVIEQGGTLIEIIRDVAPAVNAHASEAGVSGKYPREFVVNNGTLQELYHQLDLIVSMRA